MSNSNEGEFLVENSGQDVLKREVILAAHKSEVDPGNPQTRPAIERLPRDRQWHDGEIIRNDLFQRNSKTRHQINY